MRLPVMTAFIILCFASGPVLAQDADNSQTTDSGSTAQPQDSGQQESNAATAARSRGSLLDLKSAQDKVEKSRQDAPDPQARTEDSCAALDIVDSLQMPSKRKFMGPNGFERDRFNKCKSSFDDLDNACDDDSSCSDCDRAVKVFSINCGYIRPADN